MIIEIAGLLNISNYWAGKIVDLIVAGASTYAIITAIACGGGMLAIGVAILRALVKRKLGQIGYAAVVAY